MTEIDSGLPADAVTASGSGLDADISPAYAFLQAPRIARERGMTMDAVRGLITAHTIGRTLGFMGEPAVEVLGLNRALDRPAPVASVASAGPASTSDLATGPPSTPGP